MSWKISIYFLEPLPKYLGKKDHPTYNDDVDEDTPGGNNDDKNQFDADRKQFGPAASLYWSSIRPTNPTLGNR